MSHSRSARLPSARHTTTPIHLDSTGLYPGCYSGLAALPEETRRKAMSGIRPYTQSQLEERTVPYPESMDLLRFDSEVHEITTCGHLTLDSTPSIR